MKQEITTLAELHRMVVEKNKDKPINKQVCGLHIGEVSGRPPNSIIESTINAVKTKELGYTPTMGHLELRNLISKDLMERKQHSVSSSEIMITNGSKQALFYAIQLLINPGDEVIIHRPYWNSYQNLVEMKGGLLKTLDLEKNGNLNLETLIDLISSKTKMIIICSPHNPTGSIPDYDNMLQLAKIIKDKDITILSDEIYERLDFGHYHQSFAAIPEIKDKVITVGGFSKSHQMTGYRLGYLVAPLKIIKPAIILQSNICTCACTLSQYVAMDAITHQEEVGKLISNLKQRLLRLKTIFKNYPHWEARGAFYLFINISKRLNGNKNDKDICQELLDKGVAVAPGSLFMMDNYIRISYACSDEIFDRAVTILYEYFR